MFDFNYLSIVSDIFSMHCVEVAPTTPLVLWKAVVFDSCFKVLISCNNTCVVAPRKHAQGNFLLQCWTGLVSVCACPVLSSQCAFPTT